MIIQIPAEEIAPFLPILIDDVNQILSRLQPDLSRAVQYHKGTPRFREVRLVLDMLAFAETQKPREWNSTLSERGRSGEYIYEQLDGIRKTLVELGEDRV